MAFRSFASWQLAVLLLVAGSWTVALEGLERLAIDIGLIVLAGVVVVVIKQAVVHK